MVGGAEALVILGYDAHVFVGAGEQDRAAQVWLRSQLQKELDKFLFVAGRGAAKCPRDLAAELGYAHLAIGDIDGHAMLGQVSRRSKAEKVAAQYQSSWFSFWLLIHGTETSRMNLAGAPATMV